MPDPARGEATAAFAPQTTSGSSTSIIEGLLGARTAIPSAPAGMVPRPDLSARLDLAASRRLTLVSAGPGWGKTSTVSDWASQHRPAGTVIAWLSLEPGDNNPAAFWTAVLQALRTTGRTPPGPSVFTLGPAETMSAGTLQAIYQGILGLDTPIVLVLDDFHSIRDPIVLDQVGRLLQHATPLKVVLLTRTDPVLPLHKLRLSGDMQEIRADDLALRPADIATLAHAAGVDLTGALLDRVFERSGGWPAGARLAMLHLTRTGATHDLTGFGGADRTIGEYFASEVLERQTPEMGRFLQLTSVADLICADLADAIVPGGHGHEHLEALERDLGFITVLEHNGRWYRYHPLLREMLEHSLVRNTPGDFREAHARTARWLAGHGELATALRHASKAADWTLFMTIFVEGGFLRLLGPDQRLVAELLSSVPFDVLPRSAALALCAGGLSFVQGPPSALAAHVAEARALIGQAPASIRHATEACLHVAECLLARMRSDPSALIASATAALAVLDQVSVPFVGWMSMRAVASNNLAVGFLWAGQTDQAHQLFLATIRQLENTSQHLPTLNAVAHLALCALVEGRLDEASHHAVAALNVAESSGLTSRFQVRTAYLVNAYIDLLHDDVDAADRSITAGLAATDEFDELAPATALLICQASAAVSRGRIRSARHALTAAEAAASRWTPPTFLTDWLTRAKTEMVLLGADRAERTALIADLRQPAQTLSPTRYVLPACSRHPGRFMLRTSWHNRCAPLPTEAASSIRPPRSRPGSCARSPLTVSAAPETPYDISAVPSISAWNTISGGRSSSAATNSCRHSSIS